MPVTHTYEILTLKAISEKDGNQKVVNAITASLKSSETFSHTYVKKTYDNLMQESGSEEVTEDYTAEELTIFTVNLNTDSIASFVEFDSLTEETVLGWVPQQVDLESQHETKIADRKDRVLNPKKYEEDSYPLPWVETDDGL